MNNSNLINHAIDKPFYRLMLVTQKQDKPLAEYLKFIKNCAELGITAVQLREKQLPAPELFQMGQALQHLLTPFNIPLIINDNVALAQALDAQGVHLGQTDGNPQEARAQLGPHKIIGISIDSLDNLHCANNLPINYVGIGSIFKTKNKDNVTTIWGIEALRTHSLQSRHPVVAIGGIDSSNAADVLRTGAQGIAAIGALHESTDLHFTINQLLGKPHD